MVVFFNPILAQERNPADEDKYYQELHRTSPEAVTHFRLGTEAMDRGDNETAVKEYRKVLELVKDYVPAIRRLSSC